jgi:hypothetical protein
LALGGRDRAGPENGVSDRTAAVERIECGNWNEEGTFALIQALPQEQVPVLASPAPVEAGTTRPESLQQPRG